jgi:hypothetical protein
VLTGGSESQRMTSNKRAFINSNSMSLLNDAKNKIKSRLCQGNIKISSSQQKYCLKYHANNTVLKFIFKNI